MSDLAKAFGETVRRLRADRGLTQPQLADEAGLSEEWVRRIERGSASPSFETIEALAKALGAVAVPPIRVEETTGHARAAALLASLTENEAEWLITTINQLRSRPGG
jgi:transcriptional regulator with XRE-family HTH domain